MVAALVRVQRKTGPVKKAKRAKQAKRRPSMEDVAARAGVSHQTVSRVLNDSGSVRTETKERVLEAIQELGYRRNETARALATRQSRVIGIITPTFIYYGPATTLFSLQVEANKKGYVVSVATLEGFSPELLRDAIDAFLGQGVAGIIVIAPTVELAEALEEFSPPVPHIVVASGWLKGESDTSRVGIDQRSGVREVVAHLSDVGAKKVAYYAGPGNWFDSVERELAWREAVDEYGLEIVAEDRGDWTAQSGYEMTKRLLKEPLPDAVFSCNDQMALGAIRAFAEAGVEVGRDIRLVGFDDEPGTEFFQPSLTTVYQDFARLGSEAVDVLLAELEGREGGSIFIPTCLTVRSSG